jgi:hypothetical protein
MDNLILAYTGGLIDGEGTVTMAVERSNARFRFPTVSMTSTTWALVEFMKRNFGGSICTHRNYRANHSPAWSWRVRWIPAIDFLRLVLPYLREPEKKRRAELIVGRFKELTPRNGKYTPQMIEAKLAFEREFFRNSRKLAEVGGPAGIR